MQLGGERHCESEVSCPRTQHNVPGKGSKPERSNHERTNHVVVAVIGLSVRRHQSSHLHILHIFETEISLGLMQIFANGK